MNGENTRTYDFDGFRIDTAERLLRRGDEIISLTPKAAETLLVLLSNAGKMVDKESLISAIWPDTFVEEGALVRNISLLRRTLGKRLDGKEFIETIPRRGYLFVPASEASISNTPAVGIEEPGTNSIGDVEPVSAVAGSVIRQARPWNMVIAALLAFIAAGAALWIARTPRASVSTVHALAVLPFENLSHDPSEDYFAEGLTEVLISGLTHIAKLQVISLASVSPRSQSDKPPASQALDWHADAVLRCTILRKSDRVRIHAELIDARSAAVYWSENYERGPEDVWSLQNEVATAIAREIRVRLSPRETQILTSSRKVDPRALNAYLRGRYAWNRRTEQQLRAAIDYFNEAIRFQPDNALAYAGLADSYSLLASNGNDGMPPNEAMPIARTNALKALELDNNLAEAHASLAYILMSWEWNMPEAGREFQRAIELNPGYATAHHWYSHYLLAAGKPDQARREIDKALEIEPLSLTINVAQGWCEYYAKRYDKAIDFYHNTLKTDPSFVLAHQTLGMAYGMKGMNGEAIEEFKQAVELSGSSAVSVAGLINAYAAAGRFPEARQQVAVLEQMAQRRYVPAIVLANAYHSLGDERRTYEFILKGIAERSDYLIYLKADPAFASVAANPRLAPLFAQLKPMSH